MRCPKGYFLKVTPLRRGANKRFWVELHKRGELLEVGHVAVVKAKRELWETHARLDDEEHGKGFGVLMYAKAIDVALKKGFKVASSDSPSEDAIRVWSSKRLNAMYRFRRRKDNRFHVIGRR